MIIITIIIILINAMMLFHTCFIPGFIREFTITLMFCIYLLIIVLNLNGRDFWR